MYNCLSCKTSVQVSSIKDIKVHLSHRKLYGELEFLIRCCEPYCQTTADYILNFGRNFQRFHSSNFQTNECDVVMHDLDNIGLENGTVNFSVERNDGEGIDIETDENAQGRDTNTNFPSLTEKIFP